MSCWQLLKMGVDVHLAKNYNILMWEALNLYSRRTDLSVGAFYIEAKEAQTKGDMSLCEPQVFIG